MILSFNELLNYTVVIELLSVPSGSDGEGPKSLLAYIFLLLNKSKELLTLLLAKSSELLALLIIKFDELLPLWLNKFDELLILLITKCDELLTLFPEIVLILFIFPSFWFVAQAQRLSTNHIFIRLTATESFLNVFIYCVSILFFAYLYQGMTLADLDNSGPLTHFFFNDKFMISSEIMYTKLVLSLATLVALLIIKLSNRVARPDLRIFPEDFFLFAPETLLILMINCVFSLLLVSWIDFFPVILFLQGLAITNYFFFRAANSKESIANAFTYSIFNHLSSILLFLGTFLIYSGCGSLNFFVVRKTLTNLFEHAFDNYSDAQEILIDVYFQQPSFVAGCIFFIFALFFKLGLSPLHPETTNAWNTRPKPFLYVTVLTSNFTIFVLLAKVILTVFAELFFFGRPLFFAVGAIFIFCGTLFKSVYSYNIQLSFAYNTLQVTGVLIVTTAFCFSCLYDYAAGSSDLTTFLNALLMVFWGELVFSLYEFIVMVFSRRWRGKNS